MLLILLLLLAGSALAQAQPPACRYDDIPALRQDYQDWSTTLLDTSFMLNPDYAPPDLVPASAAGLSGDYQVRALMVDDLRALVEAAAAAGNPLALQSAYRSYSYQERTFAYWVDHGGYQQALRTSARAGHSEHQLGTTLDFRSAGGPPPWDLEDWAATPAGRWLMENGWRYGFIMSYPRGKEAESCYDYEPWHYRYVGRATAREIQQSGLTPRSWFWKHNASGRGSEKSR